MTEKILGICPHAIKEKPEDIGYRCANRATRMLATNKYIVYAAPCSKACAEGDYTRCPWYRKDYIVDATTP